MHKYALIHTKAYINPRLSFRSVGFLCTNTSITHRLNLFSLHSAFISHVTYYNLTDTSFYSNKGICLPAHIRIEI